MRADLAIAGAPLAGVSGAMVVWHLSFPQPRTFFCGKDFLVFVEPFPSIPHGPFAQTPLFRARNCCIDMVLSQVGGNAHPAIFFSEA